MSNQIESCECVDHNHLKAVLTNECWCCRVYSIVFAKYPSENKTENKPIEGVFEQLSIGIKPELSRN